MKFRKAFTLAEILMFFLILTILLTIIMSITKPQQAINNRIVKERYAAVHDALNIALFNIMDDEETDPFVLTPLQQANGDTHYKKLCNGLTSYINTDVDQCNTTKPTPDNVTYLSNEDFDFRPLPGNFTSMTGVKFFLSNLIEDDLLPVTDRSYYNEGDPTHTLKFFIIYADLYGEENKRHAHTIKYNAAKKEPPHVFAFAALPTGDVIPVGLAEYDPKYFTARVSYIENNTVYYSGRYSYQEAKNQAWGWYTRRFYNWPEYKSTISSTYTDYIKEILERKGSKLYEFLDDNLHSEKFNTTIMSKCKPPNNAPDDRYDLCSVVPFTPRFKIHN